MASFAPKRKARVIKVDDDEGFIGSSSSSIDSSSPKEGWFPSTVSTKIKYADAGHERLTGATGVESSKPVFGSRSGRKPFRQSGLRKAFPAADDDGNNDAASPKDDDDDVGPVVVRPSINRAGSLRQKKNSTKSRLSFGGDAEYGDTKEIATSPRPGLEKRAVENSAAKRGITLRSLPTRSLDDGEADRPRYSKEYLEELQSSTPTRPEHSSTLHIDDNNEMELDPSEIDGAVIVEYSGDIPSKGSTKILSEAEIREKKERRARLAKEQGFLSVEDEDATIFTPKKDDDTRLLAEDEDLGEGFDNFVEDGGLSLGKRAEKERRRRDRQQMAELITAAEGHSSDDSSDSDAERRIAYEAAQSKAGLDGLKKPQKDATEDLLQVPPKITPLPNLSECLARLQNTVKAMESALSAKNAHLEQVRKEREEIDKRKSEVQSLLDEAGKRYQEAMGQEKIESTHAATPNAAGIFNVEFAGERGLDSLGTTPRRPDQTEEMDLSQ